MAAYQEHDLKGYAYGRYFMGTPSAFSDAVPQAVGEELAVGNSFALGKLIWVVQLIRDRKFTSILCDLLDNHKQEVYMEAIADALLDIQDGQSIPSMIRALDQLRCWG
jgi:hypothetical protein